MKVNVETPELSFRKKSQLQPLTSRRELKEELDEEEIKNSNQFVKEISDEQPETTWTSLLKKFTSSNKKVKKEKILKVIIKKEKSEDTLWTINPAQVDEGTITFDSYLRFFNVFTKTYLHLLEIKNDGIFFFNF
jgi:hypothetical protein